MPGPTPEAALGPSASLFATESAVLRQVLGRLLAPPSETPWVDFFADDGRAARLTYFLLHRDPRGDVTLFLRETLGRLLRQLSCRTERHAEEYRGRVRGRVLWPETWKSRYSGDYDPSRFVCREVRRRFDTPENQLLVYLLDRIRQALESVPEVMRRGGTYPPSGGEFPAEGTEERLGEMEGALARLRKHVRLRQVPLPAMITPEHLRRAEGASLEEYGQVAALVRLYRELMDGQAEEGLRGLAGAGLLLPGSTRGPAEPWIRLAVALLREPRPLKDQAGVSATARRTAGSPMIA